MMNVDATAEAETGQFIWLDDRKTWIYMTYSFSGCVQFKKHEVLFTSKMQGFPDTLVLSKKHSEKASKEDILSVIRDTLKLFS